MKIILIYNDGNFKHKSETKITPELINDKNLKMLLIPLKDSINAYIPVKPSNLLFFTKANINISFTLFRHNYEEDFSEMERINSYTLETASLIDFINGLYNIYKFRGFAIFNEDYSLSNGMGESWCICPLSFKIELYKGLNELYYNTNFDMADFYTNVNCINIDNIYIHDLMDTALSYLKEFFFITGNGNIKTKNDLRKLPNIIKLNNKEWEEICNFKELDLDNDSNNLCLLADFCIYYLADSFILSSIKFNKRFTVSFNTTFTWLQPDKLNDDEYLLFPSIVLYDKKPSEYEKGNVMQRYLDTDLDIFANIEVTVTGFGVLFSLLIFYKEFLSYTKYYTVIAFGEDHNSPSVFSESFIVFYQSDEKYKILSSAELSYEEFITNLISVLF